MDDALKAKLVERLKTGSYGGVAYQAVDALDEALGELMSAIGCEMPNAFGILYKTVLYLEELLEAEAVEVAV